MSKRLHLIRISCICIATVYLASCFSPPPGTVAEVNGTAISKDTVYKRIATIHPGKETSYTPQELSKVLDQLITEELLVQAAKKEKLTKHDAYTSFVEKAKRNILVRLIMEEKINHSLSVSDQELLNYYSANKATYGPKEQRKISHIAVNTMQQAKKAQQSLKKGNSFAAVAKLYSKDPGSKHTGGDLGWFSKEQLIGDFQKAAFSLKKGAVSSIIQTSAGYHILKLTDIKKTKEQSFEDVKQNISQIVLGQKRRLQTEAYIKSLNEKASIKQYPNAFN